MGEDTMDTAAINALIDKKYELKKEKTKNTIKALSDIQAMLTAEQKKTLKGLCMTSMKK